MKRTRLILNSWLAAGAVAGLVQPSMADTKVNPYESIVERNPFALKPPPPPPPPEDPNAKTPPAPPATVELTGITSILKSKKALLEIVPGPGKPTLKSIMSEGERIESVEVVSIDVEKNEVTIRNGSLVTNLTFKVAKSTDKPGTPPGAPPPLPGGVPPAAAGLPGGNNSFGNQAGAYGGQEAGGRGVQMGGGAAPADGMRSIPPRGIRSNAGAGQQQPMTAEQSVFDIERNRAINQQISQNTGIKFPPLPPTPLNPVPQDGGVDDGAGHGIVPPPATGGRPGWTPRRLPQLPPLPGQ